MPEIKFPYSVLPRRDPSSDPLGRSSILRPLIDVRLRGPKGYIDVVALVDSGSDDTIFDCEIADAIGIDWQNGKSYEITGISGGTVKVHFRTSTFEIAGHPFNSTLGFADLPKMCKAILGQSGFFENVIVKIDQGNRRIELKF